MMLLGICLAATAVPQASAGTFGNTNTGSSSIILEGVQRGLANQSPSADGVAESIYVYLDWTNLEGGQSAAVRCAIYSWSGFGESSYLKDTTNIRTLAATSADGWYGFECLIGAALYADSNYCLQVMASVMSTDVVSGRRQSSTGDSLSFVSADVAWSDPEAFNVTIGYTLSIYAAYAEGGPTSVGKRRRLIVGNPAGGGS